MWHMVRKHGITNMEAYDKEDKVLDLNILGRNTAAQPL